MMKSEWTGKNERIKNASRVEHNLKNEEHVKGKRGGKHISSEEKKDLMMTVEDAKTSIRPIRGNDIDEQGWSTKQTDMNCVISIQSRGLLNIEWTYSHYCTSYDIYFVK